MVEIVIAEDWKEEFEFMDQAIFYANALLELIRRQCPQEEYPEKFNTLEEFKNSGKKLLGENVNLQYYEFEYLFNVLVMENVIFECDEEAIYVNKIRISDKHAIRTGNEKFDIEVIYSDKIVRKEELKALLNIDFSKYPVIKL